jgi:EPS-associated MarR family transcriptional regulator
LFAGAASACMLNRGVARNFIRRRKRHCRAVAYLISGDISPGRTSNSKIMSNSNQEIHLQVLRHVEDHPDVTQRELARHLGISLGKANYCLKALMDKGFIKARNFHNSNNKRAYLYKLTPSGIEAKAHISMSFLRRKMDEYEQLKKEIIQLQEEIGER